MKQCGVKETIGQCQNTWKRQSHKERGIYCFEWHYLVTGWRANKEGLCMPVWGPGKHV